jgi:hypothetical protein
MNLPRSIMERRKLTWRIAYLRTESTGGCWPPPSSVQVVLSLDSGRPFVLPASPNLLRPRARPRDPAAKLLPLVCVAIPLPRLRERNGNRQASSQASGRRRYTSARQPPMLRPLPKLLAAGTTHHRVSLRCRGSPRSPARHRQHPRAALSYGGGGLVTRGAAAHVAMEEDLGEGGAPMEDRRRCRSKERRAASRHPATPPRRVRLGKERRGRQLLLDAAIRLGRQRAASSCSSAPPPGLGRRGAAPPCCQRS